MKVLSPLTYQDHTHKIGALATSMLIKQYQERYHVDVNPFFSTLDEVEIYECQDTGFRFYFPLNLEGDDLFYQKISKSRDYYIEWKWEHEAVLPFLKKSDKILEVGCGRGGFVRKLTHQGYTISGTELNTEQFTILKKEGLDVYPEMLDEHSTKGHHYDSIVSFQVLEHIAQPGKFIKDALNMLTPGGKFIFCVPNNDSFIKDDPGLILNMPPHHMGLWTEASIASLGKLFNLRLDQVLFEPIQSYHYLYYLKTRSIKWFGNTFYRKILFALIAPFGLLILPFIKNKIKGQSVLAVFTTL